MYIFNYLLSETLSEISFRSIHIRCYMSRPTLSEYSPGAKSGSLPLLVNSFIGSDPCLFVYKWPMAELSSSHRNCLTCKIQTIYYLAYGEQKKGPWKMSTFQFSDRVTLLTLHVCFRITRVLMRIRVRRCKNGRRSQEENRFYTASFEDEGREGKPNNSGSF